ncbi:MAG: hypothetical protein II427_01190, partial [Firmicutes bacterium]|nr:hypothetical protein [Bacillota bacterium]
RANGIDVKALMDAQAKASAEPGTTSSAELRPAPSPQGEGFDGGLETKDGGLGSARPTETKEGESAQTRRTRAVEDAGPYEERNAERDATEAAAENGEKPQLSRRELRRAGKVRSQIVESIAAHFEGKTAAEQAAAYDSLVETYGSGIEAAASEALYNTARRTMQGAENVPTLEQRHGQDAEAFQSETARNAVERAYRDTQSVIMRATGDTTESSVRSLRDASRRAGDGFTMQAEITDKNGSTRTVDIKGWNQNGTKVVLQDGTQADVDSLQADAATKDLLEAMQNAKFGAYADEAFQTFLSSGAGQSLADGHSWIAGYRAAFGVGEVRGNVTNAVRQAARYGVDMETAAAAYYNGVKATDTVREAAKKDLPSRLEISKKGITGKRGSVLFVSEAVENKVSGDAELQDFAEDVRNFAEFFGVEVTLTESKLGWNEKLGKNVYEGSRGAHQAGRIEIDINSGKNFLGDAANGILQTMGHEMTHFLRFYNEDGYQAVRDFATEQIRNQKGQEYLDELIQRQMDGHEGDERFTRDDAIEEVVAEFCQDMLTNKKALETFAKESPKGFKAFVEWVKNFLAKIREKLARSPAATNELAIYRNLEEKVKDAFGELWAKEVMGSVRVHDAVFAEEQTEPGTETITQKEHGEERPAEGHFTGRVKFQMRESIETTDRLVAWHNMNEDALRSALELGGLAMPSWAIKTADRAHTSYGSISVIAPRALVDPKLNRSSMIFGGDAWTPVFPDVDYDISYDAVENLHDEITGLIGEDVMRELGGASLDTENIARQLKNAGGKVSNYYKKNVALRYAYLKSIGKEIAIQRKEGRLDSFGKYHNEEIKRFANKLVDGRRTLQKWREMSSQEVMQQEDLKQAITDAMAETYGEEVRSIFGPEELGFADIAAMLDGANRLLSGKAESEIDRQALSKEIDEVIDEAAYEKWIGEKLNKTIEKRGIRNEKDMFTPSGNRRSFDALHYAYNLANIVKAMKAQPKQGRTQFLSGPVSVKGAALKSYNTVEQVRNDRGRLVNSAEEGQAAYDEYNRNLEDILDRMRKNGDRFDAADALIEVFQHAKTESGIYNYMQRELKDWYNISRELAHDAYELIGQINRLPTEYFEGKTYDAVRFDETAAVVVPDNIDPALKQQLEDAGANVVEYKAGDNADRLAKVNSVEGAKFQQRDYDAPSDVDLVMGMDEKDADTPEGKALIREVQAKQKQIETLLEKLAEAKRQLTTTKRALNTKGIGNVAGNVIRDFGISDAGGKNIKQQATEILTDVYQKALDQIDSGAAAAEAWETVYNGAVEAANLLIDQGRYTENNNGRWTNVPYSRYIGENRQMVIDQMVSEAAVDFSRNRYRGPIQETAADRLVARTEKRMQGKIDETRAKNAELKAENERLEQDNTFLKDQADGARFIAGNLYDQVKDLRQELKDNRKLTAQDRKSLQGKIDRLNKQIEAKRAEAAAWRERANRNASLLKSALESKSRDIQTVKEEGQRQVDRAVAEKEAVVRKLEAQIEREQRILAGKLKPPAMQKMLKEARETAAAEMQERKNAQFQRMREGRKASELRNRIKNLSDEMKRRMTRPTDGAYVPASLYGSMTKLADVLDTVLAPNPGTKAETRYRSMMDAIHSLAAEYDGIKNLDDYTYASEFDQEIRDQISELERVLNKDRSWTDELTGDGKRVGDMSLTELQQTYDILRQINQTMKNAAKLMNNQKLGSLYDAMRNVADQQAGMRSRNASNAFTRGMRNWRLDTMSTMRAVEKMSGWDRNAALYQLMQGIEQGVVDSDIWMMNYNKRMEALKTGKNELEYRKALSKKLDYGVKDTKDGIPVMMTKLQALQILMTAEREAANDKLVHLQKGGAEIRDAVKIQEGKAAKATSYHIDVTPELLQKIRDSLTDWDKQYMQTVHDYFKTESLEMNKILYSL